MGSNRFHCSFVSSILIILHNQDVMSRLFFEIGSSQVGKLFYQVFIGLAENVCLAVLIAQIER